MRERGPTLFERLDQGSQARERMIEQNIEIFQTNRAERLSDLERSRSSFKNGLALISVWVPAVSLAILAAACRGDRGGSPLAIYDLNGDRQISQTDLDLIGNQFIDECRPSCPDFTGDGRVNEDDVKVVKSHLGEKNLHDTTPARTPNDTFVPGELLIEFDPGLSEEKIAEVYESNLLKRSGDLGVPNKHLTQFASQDIDELMKNLQDTPGVKMVGKNTLAELQ